MTYFFLDTSALAYAYAPGCDSIRQLVLASARGSKEHRVVVCDFSLPEVATALIERREAGRLSASTLASAIERLEADFTSTPSPFVVVEASGVMGDGVDLMRMYDVTAIGSVTLAAALAARASMPAGWDIVFISTDEDLLAAAGAEGFQAVRPYELD